MIHNRLIRCVFTVLGFAMILLAAVSCRSSAGASGPVKVGDAAPDFRLKNQFGEDVTLAQFRGRKNVVLYFYPKDNTSGCTSQACSFRDHYEAFLDRGAEVIGVSTDSVESHEGFAGEYALPFQLLSDAEGRVRDLYGVSTLFGYTDRITFVIDEQGVVRHVFSSMFSPEKHIEEALGALKEPVSGSVVQ